MDDFWIMRPFNALFWAVFAAFALLLAAACLLLRGKSEKAKKAVTEYREFKKQHPGTRNASGDPGRKSVLKKQRSCIWSEITDTGRS